MQDLIQTIEAIKEFKSYHRENKEDLMKKVGLYLYKELPLIEGYIIKSRIFKDKNVNNDFRVYKDGYIAAGYYNGLRNPMKLIGYIIKSLEFIINKITGEIEGIKELKEIINVLESRDTK